MFPKTRLDNVLFLLKLVRYFRLIGIEWNQILWSAVRVCVCVWDVKTNTKYCLAVLQG